MKDLFALTNKELIAMINAAGYKGVSKLRKTELVEFIINNINVVDNDVVETANEYIEKEKNVEMENAKIELGEDFSKARSFYKSVFRGKIDYERMVQVWNILNTITDSIANSKEVLEVTDIRKVSEAIRRNMFPEMKPSELASLNREETIDFINTSIESFVDKTTTEVLHKDNYKIIKLTMDDIFLGADNKMYFDSSKATVLTQDEIKVARDSNGKVSIMRKVDTSENGIFRLFCETYKDNATFLMAYMGNVSEDPIEMQIIKQKKRKIFAEGFTDIVTGEHYNFDIKGPSMNRKANCMFAPLKDWDESFDLWFNITGTKNKDGFVKAFGKEIVLEKVLARVSTRGSSSFDISKVNPELDKEIRQAKVLYVNDVEYGITKKYKTLTAPNVMELRSDERKLNPSDGSGYLKITIAAKIAKAMRVISGTEYDKFVIEWDRHVKNGGNLTTAKDKDSLAKLIRKIPHIFQIRHGEKKGLLVVADIDAIGVSKDGVNVSEYDIIIPESVRKFIGGEWNEYPLEICNYIKRKKGMVNLNPQFIAALSWENPNALIPIVDDIIKKMEDSVDNIAKALEIHKIFAQNGENTDASNLEKVLSTSASLVDERQVVKWRLNMYEKMFNNLKMGSIPVPGMYSYMVFDPNAFFNLVFGTNLHQLHTGEYYHNGLDDVECGLFRSPLNHPFEAQKVNLVNDEAYWYLSDCIVFNVEDGAWDNMGGADFDGDACAIIPNNTWQGEIVVNGIQSFDFDVWEKPQVAKKIYFVPDTKDKEAMDNLIDGLVEGAKADRTGIITNHGTRALDIANHLRSLIYFAKNAGCDRIKFYHPATYGRNCNFGRDVIATHEDGIMKTRGFVEAKVVRDSVKWNDNNPLNIVGIKTFEEVEEYINKYMTIVEIIRLLQGREIDGAKTGVFAEGVSGKDFTDFVKVIISPTCLVDRQEVLGRRQEGKFDSTFVNSYRSYSPWGRVYAYINNYLYNKDGSEKATFMNRMKEYSIDKRNILLGLLTEEENRDINKIIVNPDGTEDTLINVISKRKSEYNEKIKSFKFAEKSIKAAINDNEEKEEAIGTMSITKLKEKEYEELLNIAKSIGVSMTTIAAASYIATYNKKETNGNPLEGISYAWICLMELLEIFSRNNDRFGWFNCPKADVISVKDGVMYADGKVVKKVDAYDTDECIVRSFNNRTYAYMKRICNAKAKPAAKKTIEYSNKTFVFVAYGFKYYDTKNVDGWRKAVKANNFCFDVQLNKLGRLEMLIDGKPIAGIPNRDISREFIDGNVHKCKVTRIAPESFKENSIVDINVIVIG